MRARLTVALAAASALTWTGLTRAVAGEGAEPTTRLTVVDLSGAALEAAIEKARAYLWAQQREDGSWQGRAQPPEVVTPLVVHALMRLGCSPQDPRASKALSWLAKHPTKRPDVLGMRCVAWELANMTTAGKYRAQLARDHKAIWKPLYDASRARKPSPLADADNRSAFWQVQGLWAGRYHEMAGGWTELLAHWKQAQNADGGWGYAKGEAPNVPMTAAGLFSVQDCQLALRGRDFVGVGRRPDFPAVAKARRWLAAHFAAFLAGRHRGRDDLPACLYYLQQAAAATGQWQLADRDLTGEGAKALLAAQQLDGTWRSSEPIVSTAHALRFLAGVYPPILLARLKYDGDWNNRPHALANLAAWTGVKFSRCFDWQVLDVKGSIRHWASAQILVITGSEAPKLSAEDIAKLRLYVLRGGAIFSCTEGDGQGFRDKIRGVYKRMLPAYELKEATRDHPIYTRSVHFDLPPERVKFHILSNGIRPLVIHTDVDLPLSWQTRRHATRRWAFQAPVNVVRYFRDWIYEAPRPGRGWPEKPVTAPKRTITLARLKHAANWDPGPLAYERFRRLMAALIDLGVRVAAPVEIDKLADSGAAVATMTGVGELKLTAKQSAALKAFVQGGGTLVIDAAGGDAAFADSAERIVRTAFGPNALRPLPAGHEVYTLAGHQIERARYRRRTAIRLARKPTGNLKAVLVGGQRAGVLFSREDITAGLVGYSAWTVDGYRPGTAFALLRNIVLIAARRRD